VASAQRRAFHEVIASLAPPAGPPSAAAARAVLETMDEG
jgi:hypothetical protein